ncbi:MAG TPA: redoxin domain-containing protein [Terriglobales bacterium]|nr:redoxin domain-containing protein [Terriglobales bacterium]
MRRRAFILLAAALACALPLAAQQGVIFPPGRIPAPELPAAGLDRTGTAWLNSPPLTMKQLRGQVVLIDFWEYTCINCIRTLATNNAWYARYHKLGFTIIGVHDPEFDIAYLSVADARRMLSDPEAAAARTYGTSRESNVAAAVQRFGLKYPIVVDDLFYIWTAYDNSSWPNRFLIDSQGFIRYNVNGEGADAWLEGKIRELLTAAHPGIKLPPPVVTTEDDAFSPRCGITTPEMYIGDWHGRGRLANAEGYRDGHTVNYRLPSAVADGRAAVSGPWESDMSGMIYRGHPKPGELADRLEMRYHARQLYGVINVAHGRPERVYVMQDGHYLTAANKGEDVHIDPQGRSYVDVSDARLYYLTANPVFGAHLFAFFPTAPGFEVNSFTFGNNCQIQFPHL